MKISTKGRYALRLAIDVAQRQGNGPVSLREVSERQGFSAKYIEQLASLLMRAGILSSVRGAHGGYTLKGDPSAITAGDVLRASEGSTAPVACLEDDFGVCPMRSQCSTISFWEGLDQAIESYVDSVTLADLAAQPLAEGDCCEMEVNLDESSVGVPTS